MMCLLAAVAKRAPDGVNTSDLMKEWEKEQDKIESEKNKPVGGVKDKRPMFYTETDFRATADASLKLIETANNPPTMFKQAGELCRINTNDNGEVEIETLDEYKLRHEMSKLGRWMHAKEDGNTREVPPP